MITVTEAASRLGCSVAIIRRMCADGRITAKKYGKTWLIDQLEFSQIVIKPRRKKAP